MYTELDRVKYVNLDTRLEVIVGMNGLIEAMRGAKTPANELLATCEEAWGAVKDRFTRPVPSQLGRRFSGSATSIGRYYSEVLLARGELGKAEEVLRDSLEIEEKYDDPEEKIIKQVNLLGALIRIKRCLGNLAGARADAERLIKITEAKDDIVFRVSGVLARASLVEVMLDQSTESAGEAEQVLEGSRKMADLFRSNDKVTTRTTYALGRFDFAQGRIASARGDEKKAAELFKNVETELARLPSPDDSRAVQFLLLEVRLRLGREEEAERMFKELMGPQAGWALELWKKRKALPDSSFMFTP